MLRASAFVSEKSRARLEQEKKYYIVFSILLFISGLFLLFIPAINFSGILILVSSWLFIPILVIALFRPLFFSRGITDVVMAILTSCFYALCCWATSGVRVEMIANYRLAICLALFFAGISRILAYTRMIDVINLPLLAICGFAEMAASVLIFFELPNESGAMIYWYLGMTIVLSGFEAISEAAKLRSNY